jgi:parallel beta-helix repeat protein
MCISGGFRTVTIIFIVFFCLGAGVGTVVAQAADTAQGGETADTAVAGDASTIAACGVVDQSGAYTLAGNLSSNETCIEIVADDVLVDGNGYTVTANGTGANATGILIEGVENSTVTNLTVRDWGTGISQAAVADSTVTGVTVANTSSHGIHLAKGSAVSDNVTISAMVTDSGGNGILVEGNRRFVDGRIVVTSNITVTDSHLRGSATNGVFLSGAVRDARVEDSEVTASGQHGIYVEDDDYAGVVANNTVENPGTDGVRIRTSTDWVVRDNRVTSIDEFDSAIGSVFADRLLVVDNNVTGVIEFFAGTGPVARQNTVTDSAWDGIRLAATNARAVDNTIRSADRTGISTAGTSGSNATILDNTVVNSGSRAVSSSGQGGHLIAGNHFDNNAEGVRIFDANTVIRNNSITNHSRNALEVRADGQRLLNNTLAHNTGTSIAIDGAANTIVRNNTVRNLVRDVTNDATGIRATGAANLTIVANDVTDAATGIDISTDGGVTLATNTVSAVGDGIALAVTGQTPSPTVDTRNNTVTAASGVGFSLSTPVSGTVWNGSFRGDEITNASTPLRIENGDGGVFESVLVETTRLDLAGQNLTVDGATPTTAPAELNATGLALDIQPLAGDSQVTTLEFAYDDAVVAGLVESSLTVWRQNGTDWVESYNTTVDTATTRATVTDSITTAGTVGLFGAQEAALQIGSFAGAFPDGTAPTDYGTVSIPVSETGDVQTENLTVTLTVDDEDETFGFTATNDTATLQNETRAFPFDVGVVEEAGNYTATVTIDADNADETNATTEFRVDAPATPTLSDLKVAGQGVAATVTEGDNESVAVNVTNVGDQAGSFDVTLELGTVVTATRTTSTLGAGSTETVTFETVTGGLGAGNYGVTVMTANDTVTGNLTVEQPATPALSDLDIAGQNTTALLAQETESDITVTVANTGDRAGTFALTLEIGSNATQFETVRTVTVSAGASRQVTFENVTEGLPVDIEGHEVRVTTPERGVTGTLSVSVALAGEPARDTTGNGLLNDVRGDGEFNILDVQSLFNNLDDPTVQSNGQFFSFQQRETPKEVTILDVQELFNRL